MRVDALVALGLSPDAARAQAMREFGDIDDARRYIGAVDSDTEAAQRRSEYMHDLWQDIVYAARKLRAAPAFTAAAIVTLALGIGANTAIFSVVDHVLLQPPPFPQANRLVRVRFTQQGHGDVATPMDIVDYPTQAKDFVGFSIVDSWTANVVLENGDAERVQGVQVGANLFDLLRIKPLYGRFFREGEDKTGAPNVVVLSEQLWRRDFGGDERVIGKTVRINARPFTVIGVVPAEQRYPFTVELWTPRVFTAQELSDDSRGARWMSVVGRVKDGVSIDAANSEVRLISQSMEHRFPEMYRERRAQIVSVQEWTVGDLQKPLVRHLGRGGARPVDRVRQRREPPARPRVGARDRDGDPQRAGRGARPTRPPVDDGERDALGRRRGDRHRVGENRNDRSCSATCRRDCVLVQKASIDGRTLAATTLVALVAGLIFGSLPALQVGGTRRRGRAAQRRTRFARQDHHEPRQTRHRRRRAGARRDAAQRRRTPVAQLQPPAVGRSGVPHRERAVDEDGVATIQVRLDRRSPVRPAVARAGGGPAGRGQRRDDELRSARRRRVTASPSTSGGARTRARATSQTPRSDR